MTNHEVSKRNCTNVLIIVIAGLVILGVGGFFIFQESSSSSMLGDLCSGEDGCNEYCKNKLGYCKEYCLNNPQNELCKNHFSLEANQTGKSWEPYTTELQKPEPQVTSSPAPPSIPFPPSPKIIKQFTIAEPQPWIPDVITQPVPLGASKTRLTSLPAPPEKILLQHLGTFGAHNGAHVEGLDHEWVDIEEGTPVGSWADGQVIGVKLNNQNDPKGEWRIIIDYGDGLFGEHMDVKTPLVKVGDIVKAGQPVALGLKVVWAPAHHSGEFNLTDEHRRDGVQSWVRQFGVFVSPYDYLRDDLKKEFVTLFTKEVLEKYVIKGDVTVGVMPWEPYLTNPLAFHKMYAGTLAGEWYLKSKNWIVDETPDLITLLADNTKYYDKQRITTLEVGPERGLYAGTWEADYEKKHIVISTEENGIYYGIFELDESKPRATLKLEYQRESFPISFSDKANIYIERDKIGRGQDGYNLGVKSAP